jgi:hypothetical protein
LTLGTIAFFSRVAIALDFRAERVELRAATFFFGVAVGRLGVGFLARASDLEAADLDPLRANPFDGEALFAFGWFDLAFTPLIDFWADRPVELFLVGRVKPLVTGLLIRRSKWKGLSDLQATQNSSRSLTQRLP